MIGSVISEFPPFFDPATAMGPGFLGWYSPTWPVVAGTVAAFSGNYPPLVAYYGTNVTFFDPYDALNDFLSVGIFQSVSRRTARYIVSAVPSLPVYTYQWNYRPLNSKYANAAHGQELPFIFGAGNVINLWLNITQTPLETTMTSIFRTLLLRFVYNSNPNTPAPQMVETNLGVNLASYNVGNWSTYNYTADMYYSFNASQIALSFGMGPQLHGAADSLWDETVPFITPTIVPRVAPCLTSSPSYSACMISENNKCVDQLDGTYVCQCTTNFFSSSNGTACTMISSTGSGSGAGTRVGVQVLWLVFAVALALAFVGMVV